MFGRGTWVTGASLRGFPFFFLRVLSFLSTRVLTKTACVIHETQIKL